MRLGETRPAVFLDRDGTINVKAPEGDYITSPGQLRLLEGAAEAIRRFNDAGVLVVVVTNQRGIARELMSEQDLDEIHAALRSQLQASAGARVDAILHCPHDAGECACRKPGTGLLVEACRRFPQIHRESSVLIGDAATDVEAGRRFGIRAMRLGVDAPDLRTAAERVLAGWSLPSSRLTQVS